MSYEVTDFQQNVLDRSQQAPVDFGATGCAPCKMLSPILEQLAADAQGRWTSVTVDVDTHPALARQYQGRGIPAVRLFIGGQVVDEFSGAMPQSAWEQWLDNRLPTSAQHPMAEARLHPTHGRGAQARERLGAKDSHVSDSRGRLQQALH